MNNESDYHIDRTDTAREVDPLLPTLERFNAFSDGVFAIAITLLVLDLPIPPANIAVLPALLENLHEFLGYIISFAFIGSIWLTHSGLTKVMGRGDDVVFGVNLVLLFFVALLPFSTNLMVTHLIGPDVRVGVFFYGTNVLLASITLSLLVFYVTREPGLVEKKIDDDKLKRAYLRRWASIGVNVLALAVAFVAPLVAVGLYLVMTVMMLVLPFRGLNRKWRRT